MAISKELREAALSEWRRNENEFRRAVKTNEFQGKYIRFPMSVGLFMGDTWDYAIDSVYYNVPHRRFEYIELTIDDGPNPDYPDNATHSNKVRYERIYL